ncbi:MAG: sulfatase, partial [Planctomycetota bacterium]
MTAAFRLCFLSLLLTWPTANAQDINTAPERPNVLFIVVDDLNDWITLLDPGAPIKTPNLERLASRGVVFERAYCVSPACNPSRVAVMTGLRPSTSGVYGNKTDWRGALTEAPTIPQWFKKHGYMTFGAGKIFHHHLDGAFHDDASFDDFRPMDKDPMPPSKLNGIDWGVKSANYDWGAWPEDESTTPDVKTVDWAKLVLGGQQHDPFFLAVGVFRPHMPFHVPASYFEVYGGADGRGDVIMPPRREDDLNDIPSGGMELWNQKRHFFKTMMEADEKMPGSWRHAVRSYQAAASFADAQIGRLIDTLDSSAYADNTIIVLWSDHGYHLGEKEHWEKFALWEKATRVPLIVVAPGVTEPGGRCAKPVDLTGLYPTLIELCGLEPNRELDGVSWRPLLEDPSRGWGRPAITTYQRGNHAVRDERYRYIRYADGTEELYD